MLKGHKQINLILLLQAAQPLDDAFLLLQTLEDDFGISGALVEIEREAVTPNQVDCMTRYRAAAEGHDRTLLCMHVEDATPWCAEVRQEIEKALGRRPVPVLLRRGSEDDLRKAIIKTLHLAR